MDAEEGKGCAVAAVSPGVYKKVLAVRQAYSFDIACLLMRFFGSMLNIGVVTMITLSGYSFLTAGLSSSLIALSIFVVTPRVSKRIDERGQSAVVPKAAAVSLAGLVILVANVALHGPAWPLFVGALLVGFYPSPQAMARARWTYLIRSGRLGEAAPDLRTMFSYESVLDDAAFIFSPSISIALAAAISPVAGMVTGGVAFAVGVVLLCASRSTEPVPGWGDGGAGAASAAAEVEGEPAVVAEQPPRKSLLATSAAVRVLFVTYAFAGSFLGLFDTATVSLSEDLHSPDFAGAVLMASGAVSMTMGFLFGMVRLRAPLPKQFVVAACAVGLSFGTMFLIDSAPTLMLVALLGAATYAPLLIVANSVCERAVPDARLTEAITWLNAGYTCGAAFGPTVAGAIIDTFGTMASFKVGTVLCLGMPVTAILCYRIVKRNILPAYTVVEERGAGK
ncbi:MAG: MFS transporter [Adlercreutzia caecimuris]|uniref:MFS transporter n=1 Tax=Adlercreutzia caecimuris TaxID=671266 RepID=UPI00216DA923|nr:MFS transporter [Adlercreutzia caecimuris]MCI9207562.1 MFS transporter [Adlercreutzia caecimuris]MCI9673879.1 MFS transporter [Enterorhabdus sp.]